MPCARSSYPVNSCLFPHARMKSAYDNCFLTGCALTCLWGGRAKLPILTAASEFLEQAVFEATLVTIYGRFERRTWHTQRSLAFPNRETFRLWVRFSVEMLRCIVFLTKGYISQGTMVAHPIYCTYLHIIVFVYPSVCFLVSSLSFCLYLRMSARRNLLNT